MSVHPIFYCGCTTCKWACDNGNHRDGCPHDRSSEISGLRASLIAAERELSESKGREKVLSEMVKDSIGACCCDGKDHENDPCEYCDKAMKLLARLTPAPPEAKP